LFLVYALITVWWSWPGIWNWSTKVAYSDGVFTALEHADFYLITWTLSWVSHALATAPSTLFDGNTFFPAKLTVAYSESMLGYLPSFAPVYWASGNPILASNVTAALTYPLSALFMYRFARLYVGEAAAALSGFFYAFTIARYAMPPHLQSMGIQYFPLALLAIEQWLRRAQVRFLLVLFVALTLQCASSAYLLYAVFLMVCPFVLAAAWQHRATLDRRGLLGLAVAGVASAAAVAALMWPYLLLRDQGLVPSYDDDHTSLGLMPYFAKKFLLRTLFDEGIGWIGYGLVVVALLWRGRAARWPKRAALLLVVVGCVASLGPRIDLGWVELWSPYVLLRAIPGFATIRQPGRFAVIAQLGFALLAGLGADRLLRAWRPAVASLAAGSLALTALVAMQPFPPLPLHVVPVHGAVPPAYRWLRDHGGGRAVLELPPAPGLDRRAYRAYLSTWHWQPILDGYAANAPRHGEYVYWIAQHLPAQATLQRIVDLVDVGWILLHRDELDPAVVARWQEVPLDGIETVGEWGGDRLYRVTLPPHDDRRARLLSARETLNGLPIAPLASDCAGTLALAEGAPAQSPREVTRVRVQLTNHGSQSWPGLGFLPRDLVALEAITVHPDGSAWGGPWRTPLPDDVAPGSPLAAFVRFETPNLPGRYTLRVRVIQPSQGILDRCVTPLDVPLEVVPATVLAARDPG
jgi:hypothetical protein